MPAVLRDLTMCIREGMQTFSAPWHPFVEITQLGRHGIENRETRKLVLGTHTGTHVDAPRHFIPDGLTLDRIPLEAWCGKASVINFSELPDRHSITASELEAKLNNSLCEKLIFRFDWDKKALMTDRYYVDHPFLSLEAAEWLAQQNVKLIAMDTPQPDNPLNSRNSGCDAPIHRYLLARGILLVEYLVSLNSIVSRHVDFFAVPLQIENADGAPARCFVIENF